MKLLQNLVCFGPGDRGYIEQESQGKSYRTRLSRIGALWVRAHSGERGETEIDV